MVEIAFGTQFGWELRKAVMRVHFDAVIHAAKFIRRFEGSAISRAGKGKEFVKTIAHATKCAMGAIDGTIAPTGFIAILIGLANDLFGDFDNTVEDVAQGATELAGGSVSGCGRGLNIGRGESRESGECGSNDDEFFHAGEKVGKAMDHWQRESSEMFEKWGGNDR